MSKYEDLMRRSDLCVDAARRCYARDDDKMGALWENKSWELYDKARALTTWAAEAPAMV